MVEEHARELHWGPDKTKLTIHVLGGAFATEGRADWRYLKSMLVSSVLPNLKVIFVSPSALLPLPLRH
jgi:hypothetical protein